MSNYPFVFWEYLECSATSRAKVPVYGVPTRSAKEASPLAAICSENGAVDRCLFASVLNSISLCFFSLLATPLGLG